MGNVLLTATLLGFVCITVSLCLLWVPQWLVKNRQMHTRADFLAQYPQFNWLSRYFLFMIMLFIGVVLSFVLYLNSHPAAELLIVFAALPALFVLPDGMLTMSTGIFRKKKYPMSRNVHYFIYDPQLRIIGVIQMAVSLALILAAVLLTVFQS
jgi:hypothetical protein